MPNSKKSSVIPPSDLVREASKRFLIPFALSLDPRYTVNWHHDVIARKLEEAVSRVEDGKKARIILEIPPRHGKSELATIKFPAWLLGKHPDWPVIVSSYSADLAEDFGQKTRDIMNEGNYQAIFQARLRADSKAKGRWLTDKQGSYTATGVGGAITGRGFKVGIIDDPFKNRQDADSETIRENVWNWYTSTFYTRQEGVSAIIVIATRWHLDDLIGRLVEAENTAKEQGLTEFDEWEVIRFPAIAEEDDEYRKAGDALWPEKFSISMLENIKNTIGVTDFASLYQQDPILSENQEFRKEWFRYYEEADILKLNLKHKTTIDLAISKEKSADNSVIRTVGKADDHPNWYLREETAGHLDPLQVIDAIFYHYEKYRSEIWIETVAYQKALKYFIIEEQKKRGVYFNINELKSNTKSSKEDRIRGLIPLYKAGVIFHQKSDFELEREALQFPKGKHDDRLDTLASQLEAMDNTKNKSTYKPKPYQPDSPYEGKLSRDPDSRIVGDDDISEQDLAMM